MRPIPPAFWVLLTLAAILPIWIIPVAPLVDWPTHLAISREMYLLFQGLPQAYYYLDFRFLGYSLSNLLLVGLQYFFSLTVSGQILLSLLFPLAAVCWYAFFRLLAPEKRDWFALGLLFNYTLFFYNGMIGFVLGVHLGLLFVALGLDAILHQRRRLALFIMAGALTYLAHIYVFFFMVVLLGLAYLHRTYLSGQKAEVWTGLCLILMFAVAAVATFTLPLSSTDQTYFSQLQVCANQAQLSIQLPYNPRHFVSELLAGLINPLLNWPGPLISVFPLPNLLLGVVFLLAAWVVFKMLEASRTDQPFLKVIRLPHLSLPLDPFFTALALLALAHYLFMPFCAANFCQVNQRSFAFVFAFAALAVRPQSGWKWLPYAIAGLVVLNILFMGFVFWQAAPLQSQILSALPALAAQIPDNSTVFVTPSNWTSLYSFRSIYPPYPNVYYQALLLAQKPSLYVSGL
ncbi:MAG: hypothetical protein KGH63_01335, partial [Candidatus Micrarchaeota archaeon]|nr:hypothetical protein [Candidatus Micrarchaeota archaeon]